VLFLCKKIKKLKVKLDLLKFHKNSLFFTKHPKNSEIFVNFFQKMCFLGVKTLYKPILKEYIICVP